MKVQHRKTARRYPGKGTRGGWHSHSAQHMKNMSPEVQSMTAAEIRIRADRSNTGTRCSRLQRPCSSQHTRAGPHGPMRYPY